MAQNEAIMMAREENSDSTADGGQRPKKSKKCMRMCLTFLFSHIGLTALVIGYTIGGALMFSYIEKGKWLIAREAELNNRLPPVKEPDYSSFVAISVEKWKASWMDDKVLRFWNVTHQINEIYPDDWTKERVADINLWEVQLNEYILTSVAEMVANRTAREIEHALNLKNEPNWSFESAFLYALSIITTIGYGHVTPWTKWGKVATIFYAIVGIPITLAFLANIGDLMARGLRKFFDHLILMKQCRKIYHRKRAQSVVSTAPNSPSPIRIQKQSIAVSDGPGVTVKAYGYAPDELVEFAPEEQKDKKSVPVLMCVIIMGVYLFGGAVLFSVWEGWNYLEGLYFCFITLSTIGFGDMVPGDTLVRNKSGNGQFIACCLYILIGLAFLASCFNLLHDSARENIRVVGEKIGIIKQKPQSRRPSQAMIL